MDFEGDYFSEEDEKEIRKQLFNYSKELNRKYQNKIISYINQAIFSVCDFSLYKTQILSLLCLINKKDRKGRIAQILTGEGKTKIIIALAAYHVIFGHCVDIVTSQRDLAIRDSTDKQNVNIYDALGITVSHCITDNDENKDKNKNKDKDKNNNKKNCYDKDVIYGDTHNFQADFLYDKYHRNGMRNKRKCDIIIVDEIDSKLHPLLLKYIINLFTDPTINRNAAQLIFTSHDLSTMTNEIFRRDEIWFVAKGNKQDSQLYSLVEFKTEKGESVRKDASFNKQYLEGKYGADPYLHKIINWGDVYA